MADLSTLLGRIDAEFNASQEKIKKFQTQKVEEHKGREERLEKYGRLLEQLRERVEAAAGSAGEAVRRARGGDAHRDAVAARSHVQVPVPLGSHRPPFFGRHRPGRAERDLQLRPGDPADPDAVRDRTPT